MVLQYIIDGTEDDVVVICVDLFGRLFWTVVMHGLGCRSRWLGGFAS